MSASRRHRPSAADRTGSACPESHGRRRPASGCRGLRGRVGAAWQRARGRLAAGSGQICRASIMSDVTSPCSDGRPPGPDAAAPLTVRLDPSSLQAEIERDRRADPAPDSSAGGTPTEPATVAGALSKLPWPETCTGWSSRAAATSSLSSFSPATAGQVGWADMQGQTGDLRQLGPGIGDLRGGGDIAQRRQFAPGRKGASARGRDVCGQLHPIAAALQRLGECAVHRELRSSGLRSAAPARRAAPRSCEPGQRAELAGQSERRAVVGRRIDTCNCRPAMRRWRPGC